MKNVITATSPSIVINLHIYALVGLVQRGISMLLHHQIFIRPCEVRSSSKSSTHLKILASKLAIVIYWCEIQRAVAM